MNQQEKSINHSNKTTTTKELFLETTKKIPKKCLFSDPNPKKQKSTELRVCWCVKNRPQPHGIVTLSDPAVILW